MDTIIQNDLSIAYGINVLSAEPVDGGWLNKKWKSVTDGGTFLVKQFSRDRFGDRQLGYIADALVRQRFAGESGIPCPTVLLTADGQPLRYLDDGTVYMVMTFCEGHIETPQTVTDEQMHDLGYTLGCLHRCFSTLPADGVKGYPIDCTKMLDDLRAYCRTIPSDQRFTEIASALSPEWLEYLPKGIAHEDFSPDNLLFHADRVSAVLDFDRSCYSFLGHDIGRALMSLAWDGGVLRRDNVRAFAEEYSAAHIRLSSGDLADALRLTWCIETPWWIRPEFSGEYTPKIARFRDEVLWLTENWDKLDVLLSNE